MSTEKIGITKPKKEEVESTTQETESGKFSRLTATTFSSQFAAQDLVISDIQQISICDQESCHASSFEHQEFQICQESETADSSKVRLACADEPLKKNRRVQVPSTDISKGLSNVEHSPIKKFKKKSHDTSPQKIGVIQGIPCRRISSVESSPEVQQLQLLKHFSLVYLFSRLKNPVKWDTATFEEIRKMEESIDNSMVTTDFHIQYHGKDHHLKLSNTVAKGRINPKDKSVLTFRSAFIEHVSSHSGLVVKYKESHFMMIWRVIDGYYLYDACLKEVSQLMFINSLRLTIEFIIENHHLNERSKFFMSKISWHAVDDGITVTLKRKSRIPKRFKMLNQREALLMGDRFIKSAGHKLESLKISLNAIDFSGNVEARSWDSSNLNALFNGEMTDKEINKLGVFLLEEGDEDYFLLDKVRLIRLNVSFGYTEREAFEQLLNRLLAIRIAIILRVEEYYFSVWSSGNILYWFSPFRYDSLKLDSAELEDKACFLFAFSLLDRLSTMLFEYLTEIGLLPTHRLHIFTVDDEPFGKSARLKLTDSQDSLMRNENEINVPESVKPKEYVRIGGLPPMTLSESKVCRLMLREIMGSVENNNDE